MRNNWTFGDSNIKSAIPQGCEFRTLKEGKEFFEKAIRLSNINGDKPFTISMKNNILFMHCESFDAPCWVELKRMGQ